MGFLSPWFLLGAAAVALPLWLHLLRRFKQTPQPFSSLMFFERREQSSVKHRKLRYLALLSLRIALLLLLALAFANPFVQRRSKVQNRRTLNVIALDRSFSMQSGDRMPLAKEKAKELVTGLPAQSLAETAALDAHVESLTAPGASKAELIGSLNALRPTDRASSFGEFTRAMRALAETTGMHLSVDLVSDMQQTSMPSDFRNLTAGPNVSLHLYRVGEQKRPNWSVESVDVPSSVGGNSAVRLTAVIAGWNTPAASRTVSLSLDGKQLAEKSVTVPANGKASVSFADFPVSYGSHRGELAIKPEDNLPQDDIFPFSIEHEDPKKVLFLYANGRRTGREIYYKTALESGTRDGLTLQASPANGGTGLEFTRFAFVVLDDVGRLDPKLSDALCAYVIKGGSVLISIGPNTADSGIIPLSKEQFREQRQTLAAGYVDSAHPALAAAGQFQNVQFSETAVFPPKANARILARFSDGSPLLVEEQAGEGRKLIFASTLDNSTNDFALHASFVPFVVQTARYLAGLEDNPSNLVIGTPVSLRHESESGSADVVGPDGKHELSLSDAARRLSFDLNQSGFYEVTRADGRRALLAVHPESRESNLLSVSDETLNLWRNTGDTAQHPADATQQIQTRPWNIWRYFLVAALLVGFLESLFAGRYMGDGQRKEERQTG